MSAEITADRKLDLKGEVCPYTFVRSKLELETMEIGQVLLITVDNNESASNVPRSLALEGHEVHSVKKEGGSSNWHILVTKKE